MELAKDSSFDFISYFFDQDLEWVQLIKTVRAFTGDGLQDAIMRALKNDRWRSWCAQRVTQDKQCMRQARHFASKHLDQDLLVLRDGKPVFRP
jgi:hypothetical protein